VALKRRGRVDRAPVVGLAVVLAREQVPDHPRGLEALHHIEVPAWQWQCVAVVVTGVAVCGTEWQWMVHSGSGWAAVDGWQ
jgi:hypothetical protein